MNVIVINRVSKIKIQCKFHPLPTGNHDPAFTKHTDFTTMTMLKPFQFTIKININESLNKYRIIKHSRSTQDHRSMFHFQETPFGNILQSHLVLHSKFHGLFVELHYYFNKTFRITRALNMTCSKHSRSRDHKTFEIIK